MIDECYGSSTCLEYLAEAEHCKTWNRQEIAAALRTCAIPPDAPAADWQDALLRPWCWLLQRQHEVP